jgi:hypothetical protein
MFAVCICRTINSSNLFDWTHGSEFPSALHKRECDLHNSESCFRCMLGTIVSVAISWSGTAGQGQTNYRFATPISFLQRSALWLIAHRSSTIRPDAELTHQGCIAWSFHISWNRSQQKRVAVERRISAILQELFCQHSVNLSINSTVSGAIWIPLTFMTE